MDAAILLLKHCLRLMPTFSIITCKKSTDCLEIMSQQWQYRYGVLPMAISRDTVVAICLAGTSLDVSNHIDNLFPAYSFVPDPTQLVDTENHVWANYALAAYKGVHDYLNANPAAETHLSRQFPGIKVCCKPSSVT
jgi:galactokinase